MAGAVLGAVLARVDVVRGHAPDLHETPPRDRSDAVFGLADPLRDQLRWEEQKESLDPHPTSLRCHEVTGLMEDDQEGEAEHHEDPAHASANSSIWLSARRRASSSTAKRSSK